MIHGFEQNKYVRDNKLDRSRAADEFGHMVARIPYTITWIQRPDGTSEILDMDLTGWNALITLYPDLNSPDADIANRAWKKFLSDTDKAAPFKVDGSIGNVNRLRNTNSGTIVFKGK